MLKAPSLPLRDTKLVEGHATAAIGKEPADMLDRLLAVFVCLRLADVAIGALFESVFISTQ